MPNTHRRQSRPNLRQHKLIAGEFLESRRLLAVFTVNNLDDDGPGSLRNAVAAANSNSGEDTVLLAPNLAGNINLLSEISITDSMRIDGHDAPGVTISGRNMNRLFNINTIGTVSFEEVALKNGKAIGDGGAILAHGTDLRIANSTITGNTATGGGGAVALSDGSLTTDSAYFAYNHANNDGGAVWLLDSEASQSNTTFVRNNSGGRGGGIRVDNDQFLYLFSNGVSFFYNDAQVGGGAAINADGLANVTLNDTTVTNNSAADSGGGLYLNLSAGANAVISGAHVSSNQANYNAGVDIRNTGATLLMDACTITLNTANTAGGGVGLMQSSGSTEVSKCNISQNTADFIGGLGLSSQPGYAGRGMAGGDELTVRDTTISGNSAVLAAGGVGIFRFGSDDITMLNSTVSGNTAGANAGGVYVSAAGGVDIQHSTIADNVAGLSYAYSIGGGLLLTYGSMALDHTLIGNNRIALSGGDNDVNAGYMASIAANHCLLENIGLGTTITGANNMVNVDPMLGSLDDNGGATKTHALLLGSLAIDAGDATLNSAPTNDQRGTPFVRIIDGTGNGQAVADIGAFELQSSLIDGDFDDDGAHDIADLDALIGVIAAGTHDPNFDLTGDGDVDLADRDAWLAEAGALNLPSGNDYLLGDANLDGVVDGLDFVAWNTNKFTATGTWSGGDFNADGQTNGQDFVIWNANKFRSADHRLAEWTRPEY